jgi:hypothetical protein
VLSTRQGPSSNLLARASELHVVNAPAGWSFSQISQAQYYAFLNSEVSHQKAADILSQVRARAKRHAPRQLELARRRPACLSFLCLLQVCNMSSAGNTSISTTLAASQRDLRALACSLLNDMTSGADISGSSEIACAARVSTNIGIGGMH